MDHTGSGVSRDVCSSNELTNSGQLLVPRIEIDTTGSTHHGLLIALHVNLVRQLSHSP
jgi:hypothetical protein